VRARHARTCVCHGYLAPIYRPSVSQQLQLSACVSVCLSVCLPACVQGATAPRLALASPPALSLSLLSLSLSPYLSRVCASPLVRRGSRSGQAHVLPAQGADGLCRLCVYTHYSTRVRTLR